jgi:hypothetical protein
MQLIAFSLSLSLFAGTLALPTPQVEVGDVLVTKLVGVSTPDQSQDGVGNVLNGAGNGANNLVNNAGNGVGNLLDSAGSAIEKRNAQIEVSIPDIIPWTIHI